MERKAKMELLTSSILSLSELVIGSNSDPNSNFLLVEYTTEVRDNDVDKVLGLVSFVNA